ncbi:hypothetical protein [Carnobacterium inhibens]|uniref:hypothetical protein n=1 Tax=Carnobacterium inhibens TaxID=147709 RepID=UPI000552E77E|nr:hypothetical protein [Carnobacterium inhibens]
MNKKVFGFNWFFRKSDGLLYGYTIKPAVVINNHPLALAPMLGNVPEVRATENDKSVLIAEEDNELSFIKINKLYHVTELIKENVDDQ